MKEHLFTDNRRGYRDGDYSSIPRRKVWPTLADAVASMSGNSIAFRVYDETDRQPPLSNPFTVSILCEYRREERPKRGKPYVFTGQTCLASCQADANEQLDTQDKENARAEAVYK